MNYQELQTNITGWTMLFCVTTLLFGACFMEDDEEDKINKCIRRCQYDGGSHDTCVTLYTMGQLQCR